MHIHNIKGFDGKTDLPGGAYFGPLGTDSKGNDVYFSSVAKEYDWVNNDGYNNFATWVWNAAKAVGK